MRRFHDDQNLSVHQPVLLGDDASHHIARVLRMQPGDEIELFNGRGGAWHAVIREVSRKGVVAEPLQFLPGDATGSAFVTVALPFIKGERMDYAIQKATELGAGAFRLVELERSDVRLKAERGDRKLQHLQQVAISACEQCGMNRIPTVHGPVSLDALLQEDSSSLRIIAHPARTPLSADLLQAHERVLLITGPEGGFSSRELEQAMQAGCVPLTLGPRVLRAETAPTALLAALWALRGN